jgi:hypothetical protein
MLQLKKSGGMKVEKQEKMENNSSKEGPKLKKMRKKEKPGRFRAFVHLVNDTKCPYFIYSG